jgi:hypothetical protein
VRTRGAVHAVLRQQLPAVRRELEHRPDDVVHPGLSQKRLGAAEHAAIASTAEQLAMAVVRGVMRARPYVPAHEQPDRDCTPRCHSEPTGASCAALTAGVPAVEHFCMRALQQCQLPDVQHGAVQVHAHAHARRHKHIADAERKLLSKRSALRSLLLRTWTP